jgi:tRNA-dihydrouridine synthase C
MLDPNTPALVLAPMDGITDAPMRALQGATGAFSFAVSEFLRVSIEPLPLKVFRRDVPELAQGCLTPTGMPVQVQLLGGDPGRMAKSAVMACRAGAQAVDINFGCPAPTVNRHDGGASLLHYPKRIGDIVRAVRDAVPVEVPVSAKLRLGWDSIESIHENAASAAEAGAAWLTIHARTRVQGYTPPVYWQPIGRVRQELDIPVVANGDIWTIDDFRQCQEETGCIHFMMGRGALANPHLPFTIAADLGIGREIPKGEVDWVQLLRSLGDYTAFYEGLVPQRTVMRLKQWLKIASNFGDFPYFDQVKKALTVEEFFSLLEGAIQPGAIAS